MHYAYVDGKKSFKPSNARPQNILQITRGCRIQASRPARSNSIWCMTPTTVAQSWRCNNPSTTKFGSQNNRGYIQSKGHIATMIQPVPISKKEQRSISRQVNLAITSPLATTAYLNWSDQTVEFSRANHPRKVPRPGHTPMVLKAQIGGYDVERVFMMQEVA
jgi:hypothetical protein